jgi:hypothetical protein
MINNRRPAYGVAGFAGMIANKTGSGNHEGRQSDQGNDPVESPLPHSTHLVKSDAKRRVAGAKASQFKGFGRGKTISLLTCFNRTRPNILTMNVDPITARFRSRGVLVTAALLSLLVIVGARTLHSQPEQLCPVVKMATADAGGLEVACHTPDCASLASPNVVIAPLFAVGIVETSVPIAISRPGGTSHYTRPPPAI